MEGRAQAEQQHAAAEEAALESQQEIQQLQNQMAQMQAQQAQATVASQAPVPTPAQNDLMSQLQQLAQLKESGALTDEEFAAAKAKLLAG